jgi:pimeloyl-ACP methyl ester carboxylesterase
MPFVQTDDDVSLFFRDWGEGEPVVFCAAWALSSIAWQCQMIGVVDSGRRAVAYDRRGHGRSDDPGRGYRYDTLADDLARVVELLELRDVTLVAHSMGSGEAVRYQHVAAPLAHAFTHTSWWATALTAIALVPAIVLAVEVRGGAGARTAAGVPA